MDESRCLLSSRVLWLRLTHLLGGGGNTQMFSRVQVFLNGETSWLEKIEKGGEQYWRTQGCQWWNGIASNELNRNGIPNSSPSLLLGPPLSMFSATHD
mmetsp:Transcript_20285/g.48778  ORF Transcript_20285/g.48778 Transcript_20285/m.48778 type:complete len:98 (+) Transcript_20285:164-457(+)